MKNSSHCFNAIVLVSVCVYKFYPLYDISAYPPVDVLALVERFWFTAMTTALYQAEIGKISTSVLF